MAELRAQIKSMPSVYQLFVTEAEEHLRVIAEIVQGNTQNQADERPAEISANDLTQLEQRLHLLKGGSGFLKLTAIHALCTAAHERFKHASTSAAEDTVFLCNLITQLQNELESVRKLMQEI